MNILRKLNTLIDYFMRAGIILITICVVTSMTLQVCNRYFLPLPIYGFDEFTGHTAVWFYFLGAAYSAAHSDHIKADMMDFFRIPLRGQHIISLFNSLISVGICGLMSYWAFKYVLWSIQRNELTPSLQMPTVFFQMAILVGAVLMCIYFLKEFYHRVCHRQPFVKEEYESLISNQ